ncbi:hypothetical protein WMY93_021733 [Mugilogobius chulae]|uniref:Uncharacterized protein n=1 Tax=Mugilogobius chulae TaxID=88201 RepID=A0AAW0NBN9_9GOBI
MADSINTQCIFKTPDITHEMQSCELEKPIVQEELTQDTPKTTSTESESKEAPKLVQSEAKPASEQNSDNAKSLFGLITATSDAGKSMDLCFLQQHHLHNLKQSKLVGSFQGSSLFPEVYFKRRKHRKARSFEHIIIWCKVRFSLAVRSAKTTSKCSKPNENRTAKTTCRKESYRCRSENRVDPSVSQSPKENLIETHPNTGLTTGAQLDNRSIKKDLPVESSRFGSSGNLSQASSQLSETGQSTGGSELEESFHSYHSLGFHPAANGQARSSNNHHHGNVSINGQSAISENDLRCSSAATDEKHSLKSGNTSERGSTKVLRFHDDGLHFHFLLPDCAVKEKGAGVDENRKEERTKREGGRREGGEKERVREQMKKRERGQMVGGGA